MKANSDRAVVSRIENVACKLNAFVCISPTVGIIVKTVSGRVQLLVLSRNSGSENK